MSNSEHPPETTSTLQERAAAILGLVHEAVYEKDAIERAEELYYLMGMLSGVLTEALAELADEDQEATWCSVCGRGDVVTPVGEDPRCYRHVKNRRHV